MRDRVADLPKASRQAVHAWLEKYQEVESEALDP